MYNKLLLKFRPSFFLIIYFIANRIQVLFYKVITTQLWRERANLSNFEYPEYVEFSVVGVKIL